MDRGNGRTVDAVQRLEHVAEIAIQAPVLPAEIQASARPSLTACAARRMDEFLLAAQRDLDRIVHGDDLGRGHDVQAIARRIAPLGQAASIASGSPTSNSRVSGYCRANSIAAGIVTGRPKSPPMQSIAMRITGARSAFCPGGPVREFGRGLIRQPWSSGPCGRGRSRWG